MKYDSMSYSTKSIEYKKSFMANNCLADEYGAYKSNTAEENTKLFKKYAETHDPAIREEIILGNLKLALKIAHKYISPDAAYSFEDIIHTAVLGLITAVDTFDYRKGYTFTTYGMKVITSQVNMIFRRFKYTNLIMSLDDPIRYDSDGNYLTIGDTIVDDRTNIEEDVEHVIMCSLIKSELDYLTEKERAIIIDRFGLNGNAPLKQRELSVKYGHSQPYICRIISNALKKLKVRLLSTI